MRGPVPNQFPRLTINEAKVICWRLMDNWTLADCAKELSVTLERARQIEFKGYLKLKRYAWPRA